MRGMTNQGAEIQKTNEASETQFSTFGTLLFIFGAIAAFIF